MRVLAITPLYPPVSRVGAWLATHQFMRHLVQRGHEVSVFSRMSSSRGWELDGVRVVTRRTGHVRRLVEQADVVVSHCGDGGFGAEAAAGKPSVRIAHGALSPGMAETGGLIVFNSRSSFEASGYAGESLVCHPPTFVADHRVPSTGDAVTIVNCSKEKGIKTAWTAATMLPERRFLGVKGGYGHQLIPRAPNFETVPTQSDMRDVWAETRILLMPSIAETWGMVGIEAMCSGIPVIAHPTPGLRESLGDAGIFIDRDDIERWAAAIRWLDDPETYEKASRMARERADAIDPTESLDRFADAVEALA